MSHTTDIPGARRAIEMMATKMNIYVFMGIGLCGSVVFVGGLVSGGADGLSAMPDPAIAIVLGMMVFSLFVPCFTALYVARHILYRIERVEEEMARLKTMADSPSPGIGTR